jgi:hypothetical protein
MLDTSKSDFVDADLVEDMGVVEGFTFATIIIIQQWEHLVDPNKCLNMLLILLGYQPI